MLAGVTPGQGALYAIGAASELLGIGLVAAPDLVPGARRFSRWLGPRWRTIENRLRRRLHLPLRSITHSVEMTGTVVAAVPMETTAPLRRRWRSRSRFSCDGTKRRRK